MAKKDLVYESNNLSIIVILSLFLICSLGYIAYEKILTHIGDTDNVGVMQEINYNKDGIYIRKLMDKILYHSGINHDEYQLFAKEEVTVDDLSENYKNALVFHNINGSSYSIDNLANSSQDIFGKSIFMNYPEKINVLCDSYHLRQDGVYEMDSQSGSCGGTGYQYYEKIESVSAKKDHIYVTIRVGFQCDGGICNVIEKDENDYKATHLIKKLDSPTSDVNLNDIEKDLARYTFTFTYDYRNNLYYFERVRNKSIIY